MLRAWLSVISELTAFIYSEVHDLFFPGNKASTHPLRLTTRSAPVLLPSHPSTPLLGLQNKQEPAPMTTAIPYGSTEPMVMYVIVPDALCYSQPHDDFDGVLTRYSYGSAVTVTSYVGRFAHVQRQNLTGWMQKDDLATTRKEAWPEPEDHGEYAAENEVTTKIRQMLNDEFRGGALSLPLQPGEYALYRLRQDNLTIEWPPIRPRTPGTWQKVLRGSRGIHIGIAPRTGSIMEWIAEGSDEGYLAYVEKVLPDLAIELSMVGQEAPGVYTRTTMPESAWRELRPVFIEIK